MGIGKTWDYGSKRSNFAYQRRLLQEVQDCCGSPIPPPIPPTFYFHSLAIADASIDPTSDYFPGLVYIDSNPFGALNPWPASDCSMQNEWVNAIAASGIYDCVTTAPVAIQGSNLTDCGSGAFYYFQFFSNTSYHIEFNLFLLGLETVIPFPGTVITPVTYCATGITLSTINPIISYTFVVPQFSGGTYLLKFNSQFFPQYDQPVQIMSDLQLFCDQCLVMTNNGFLDYTVTETSPGVYDITITIPSTWEVKEIELSDASIITFNPC
jgi:hypothetical protein